MREEFVLRKAALEGRAYLQMAVGTRSVPAARFDKLSDKLAQIKRRKEKLRITLQTNKEQNQ